MHLLQERPKRVRRNGLQIGANAALGSGGGDDFARDAFDRLLADGPADEPAADAQPEGQQTSARQPAADVQSDDTQTTQPLPHSPGGAADADELAGAGMAAGVEQWAVLHACCPAVCCEPNNGGIAPLGHDVTLICRRCHRRKQRAGQSHKGVCCICGIRALVVRPAS